MKLQRRLTFHFIYQLIIYALLIFVAIMTLIFGLINQTTNQELKRNFPAGTLDAIIMEAVFQDDKIDLSKHWSRFMKERNIWLQIVNVQGNVIYESNTGAAQPTSYSLEKLLMLQHNRLLGNDIVESRLDQSYEEPLLFLLGYDSPRQRQLAQWYEQYGQHGLVADAHIDELRQQLEQSSSYLTIFGKQGESVQVIGDNHHQIPDFQPLEILTVLQASGDYDSYISVYQHNSESLIWVLRNFNELDSFTKPPVFVEIIRIFIWLGAAMLLLSLTISIWHGYRYSQPLILFSGWFERMGKGLYEEVLTPRDKRRIFRRNGKLRIRYRLYREVIQAFYEMAERLAQIEKDRKQLDKTREQWMSGISHDLRTPLSTIQGYGYILEHNPSGWSQAELQEMGHMIREKSDYMLELITDFSFISQIKQNAFAVEMEQLELNELVRRSVLKYVNDATLTDIEFRYEGDMLPLFIVGNERWLQRLMDNLLSNAAKHNPPGTTVSASAGMFNDIPFISVSDNGVGMNEDTQQMLFERYYRGTNTEEPSAGSGLGMSIAKMIVEAHDGRIEVSSAIHRGTEITVYFPQN